MYDGKSKNKIFERGLNKFQIFKRKLNKDWKGVLSRYFFLTK